MASYTITKLAECSKNIDQQINNLTEERLEIIIQYILHNVTKFNLEERIFQFGCALEKVCKQLEGKCHGNFELEYDDEREEYEIHIYSIPNFIDDNALNKLLNKLFPNSYIDFNTLGVGDSTYYQLRVIIREFV